jgi:glucoamylase
MRDIPVGNGSLLVNFDDKYQIRDIFFPHVGQENHSEGFPFRFGLWVDGEFSWTFADGWDRRLGYRPESLVTEVVLVNLELEAELRCSDTVASHENVFLRRVRVTNLGASTREFRIFLHHDFRIYENKVGDTAFFDPQTRAIIHYKKHRYFLINTDPPFDAFATGRKAFRDLEGTWRDAEDGELNGGAITEGSVDSTIGLHFEIAAAGAVEFYYWIAAAITREGVTALNAHVLDRKPQEYLSYTENYWRAWVNKSDADLAGLPPKVAELYKRSLLVISTQTDHDGAFLAANDSDVALRATDHYSYLWTRDGAFVANALDSAGFDHITRKFYRLCGQIVHPDGYFLQKYNADGTVASGWHPAWDAARRIPMVPIQEDETALVLWALWRHYETYRDIEFAQRLYPNLVKRCADFMVAFREQDLGLPSPSWNLWEDSRGIHTFTCAAVAAGLRAAANFSRLFAEEGKALNYETAADEIVDGMRHHLFDQEAGRFARALLPDDSGYRRDMTIDASLFGLFYFGCFAAEDAEVAATMDAVATRLSHGVGVARFENDNYMRAAPDAPENSWFICTLWLAEYYIAAANSRADLKRSLAMLEWVADSALPSGVLAEQIDPVSALPASVSPLTWSHSTFVAAVASFQRKLRSFRWTMRRRDSQTTLMNA